jgi:hypothetical protein
MIDVLKKTYDRLMRFVGSLEPGTLFFAMLRLFYLAAGGWKDRKKLFKPGINQ